MRTEDRIQRGGSGTEIYPDTHLYQRVSVIGTSMETGGTPTIVGTSVGG